MLPKSPSRVSELVLVALAIWCIAFPILRDARASHACIDFGSFYAAAKRVAAHKPLYVMDFQNGDPPYVFTPALAEMLAPLAVLPKKVAEDRWLCFNWACLLLSAFVFNFGKREHSLIPLAIAIATAFHFWPTNFEFLVGNIDCEILLVFCAMFAAERSQKRWLLPILIATGTLLKTWFIGMTLYLVLSRRWKEAFASVGLFLCSLVVLFLPLQAQEWSRFVQLNLMFLKNSSLGDCQVPHSILGFARIHLSQNHWVYPLIDNPILRWGFVAVAFALVFAVLVYAFKSAQDSEYERDLKLGLTGCSLLLLMPLCEIPYLLLGLPLVWTLLTSRESNSKFIAAAFAVYAFGTRITWSTSGMPPVMYSGLKSMLFSDGFFWLVSLWGTAAVALWYHRRGARQFAIPSSFKDAATNPAAQPIEAEVS